MDDTSNCECASPSQLLPNHPAFKSLLLVEKVVEAAEVPQWRVTELGGTNIKIGDFASSKGVSKKRPLYKSKFKI